MPRDADRPLRSSRSGHDPGLERRALDCAAARDFVGCREALERLLLAMDHALGRRPGRIGPLLLDVLQKINQLLNHPDRVPERYQRGRWRLIELFADRHTGDAVLSAFREGLEGLLEEIPQEHRGGHPLIDRARSMIHRDFRRRISLSTVAGALGVSPNYLSGLFRRETGSTITAYIQRVRLQRARLLMADDGRTISEIAYQVGYQTYRDFYRNFVKYEQSTPKETRRRLVTGGNPPQSGPPLS